MFMALSALTRRVNNMIVKAVCKLAYKQVLVAFCSGSNPSKALKVFILVYFLFLWTLVFFMPKVHFLFVFVQKLQNVLCKFAYFKNM